MVCRLIRNTAGVYIYVHHMLMMCFVLGAVPRRTKAVGTCAFFRRNYVGIINQKDSYFEEVEISIALLSC